MIPEFDKNDIIIIKKQKKYKKWNYSPEIDKILKHNVLTLVDWINNGKGPFSKEYVEIWYNRYLQLSRRQ